MRGLVFRGHFPKDMPFNYRKWNILAFRGQLMSLLAPARGMSTLPAKGGFSRPSSFTHSDRKSTRLNSSHVSISYAVFCLNKKNQLSERWLNDTRRSQD